MPEEANKIMGTGYAEESGDIVVEIVSCEEAVIDIAEKEGEYDVWISE